MLKDFRPLPLLRNPHIQTLLGNFWRGGEFRGPVREAIVELPDGDRLVLHDSMPIGWQPRNPTAVLAHGLGGCHQSPYMQRVAIELMNRGWRVVRMDLRGCGRGAPLARKLYNAGRSDDLRAALTEVHRWSPESPITALGFSLGGNIVLKLAGEAADRTVAGLARTVAVAPPIDLELCGALLARPKNALYDRYFVRDMLTQIRQREQHFPDEPRARFPRPLTVRIFDEVYTAPKGGFANALDYYRRSSSAPLLPRIPMPTLILTARDDPFIAIEPFESAKVPSHVAIKIVRHGGHLGFLGSDGAGGVRWAERFVVDWMSNGALTRSD
jgi:predicted alpha/beta-fold hydrolase